MSPPDRRQSGSKQSWRQRGGVSVRPGAPVALRSAGSPPWSVEFLEHGSALGRIDLEATSQAGWNTFPDVQAAAAASRAQW
jgi:hypothetical protein